MMRKLLLFLLATSLFFVDNAQAQVNISGNSQTALYAWENDNATQQWDLYQNIGLRVTPQKYTNLRFKTYFRFGRLGDPAEWNEKVYNALISWKSSSRKYQVRAGRQFLYAGVMNGTVDGLLFSARPMDGFTVKLLGGISAPLDRTAEIEDPADYQAVGGYASYQATDWLKWDVSFYQRNRAGDLSWQQAGTALSGKIADRLYYQSTIDYNVAQSALQGLRLRFAYYLDKWSVSAEYNSQKPRIYENSFFQIFEIEAFNQLRSAVTYRIGDYLVGLRYLFTAYAEGESTNQAEVTFNSKLGMLGVLYQSGFSGDNIGFFGELRWEFIKNFELRLYSSHYQYELQSTAISEEATAFSGGLDYRLNQSWLFRAEVQESMNSFYKNDLRGLFRINYAFNY